jgi:hypothetical protein
VIRTNIVSIPVSLELSEKLAWCIGFYLAEGDKTKDYIGVSNCNMELIKEFQNIMEEIFKIDKNLWKIHIKTPSKDLESIKAKWRILLNMENISALHNYLAKEDSIELRLNSRRFAEFFNRMLKEITSLILEDKALSLSFLNGYEVGDGSIIQRRGYLYGIAITTEDEIYKNILVEAFQNLYSKKPHVRINKGKYYEVSLTGVNIMTELILDGHFKLHKEKRNKLINTYLRKIYTRSHKRYWDELKNKRLAVEELSKAAKRSHWAVRDAMNKDSKLGLIKIEKGRIPRKHGVYHIFYSLTEKCNNLLDILNGVKM